MFLCHFLVFRDVAVSEGGASYESWVPEQILQTLELFWSLFKCSLSQPADMAAMCEGCTDIPAPTSILSFVISSSLFFTCFLSLARRFWNHIFTYKTTSYTWSLEENCCSVPVSQINSVPALVQPFFWWWCICCSETPSPAPVSGGHCTLLGTYPWFWSDL